MGTLSNRGPRNALCGVCDGVKVMPVSGAPCWQCVTQPIQEQYAKSLEKQFPVQALCPQNEAGFIKGDSGKEVYALIDADFEAGIARVLTSGSRRYTDDNWKLCTTPWRTYYSALRRHLAALQRGDEADPDTGESHVYHAACCLMFIGWFERHGKLLDRPGAGPAAPAGG